MSHPVDAARGDPAMAARRSTRTAVLYGVAGTLVVAAPTAWVATSDANFGIPRAATASGDEVVGVWRVLMTMATAVAALVIVLLAVAVVSGARRSAASPSKGSVPLELVYTAVPVALVAAIFGMSLWLGGQIGEATRGDALVIDTEAFRWGWRFTYPNGVVVVGASPGDEPVVVLPVDRAVTFDLHSPDVIHSFFVPAFTTKLDVIPGHENRLTVRADQLGEYRGHCAEFCGLDHARMNFRVSIVDQAQFDAWLEDPDAQAPR